MPDEQPQLAGLRLLVTPRTGIVSASVIALAMIVGSLSVGRLRGGTPPFDVPRQLSDLGPGFVTPVDPANRAAAAAAVAALPLARSQRADMERAVLSHERRIGWIVFMDSMDQDGDVVAVDAGGLVQHVALTKTWIPVAVPLDQGPVGITGVKDGGGGITVAVATRGGPVAMRVLLPGERIEVAAP